MAEVASIKQINSDKERLADSILVDIYKTKAMLHDKIASELDVMRSRLEDMVVESLLEVETNHLTGQIGIFQEEAKRQRDAASELHKKVRG